MYVSSVVHYSLYTIGPGGVGIVWNSNVTLKVSVIYYHLYYKNII